MNPNKVRAVEFLVRYHEARGDKIILFLDSTEPLQFYAKLLQQPMTLGETKAWERELVLECFRQSDSLSTVCLSRIGDMSINLPDANVIIQVSSHFGARQQEAQRLGRILRPKRIQLNDGSYNAYFYSVVSQDTKEVEFS